MNTVTLDSWSQFFSEALHFKQSDQCPGTGVYRLSPEFHVILIECDTQQMFTFIVTN